MGTLKRLLPTTETELFRNWDDTGNEVSAVSMLFCNTSLSPVDVWVSFVDVSGVFVSGAIFSGFTILANSSEYKEIPKRILALNECIRAYASVADVVSFSVDLIGVDESNIPTAEIP